jgi:hypothetical protein
MHMRRPTAARTPVGEARKDPRPLSHPTCRSPVGLVQCDGGSHHAPVRRRCGRRLPCAVPVTSLPAAGQVVRPDSTRPGGQMVSNVTHVQSGHLGRSGLWPGPVQRSRPACCAIPLPTSCPSGSPAVVPALTGSAQHIAARSVEAADQHKLPRRRWGGSISQCWLTIQRWSCSLRSQFATPHRCA